IGGVTPGIDFDKLSFLSAATLSGTLNISVTNGYLPNVGDRFVVLSYPSETGRFITINGRNIGSGRSFQEAYGSTTFTLTVQGGGPTSTPTPPPGGTYTPTPTPPSDCGHFSDVQ